VQLAALLAPVLGAASGYGAEALVRRVHPARGWRRIVLMIAVAVLVIGAVAWQLAGAGIWWQAAVLALAVVAVPLSAMDLAEQRIPNRLLGPASVLALALLGLDAATGHRGGALVRAVLAAGVLYTGAVIVLLAVRDSLGYGDAKALAYQGVYTGYLGWSRVLGALLLAFAAAALAAAVLVAVRRGGRPARIASAPYLVGATLTVVLLR
jgi:leader peptidase (prepilin peptidase)/N-methyltransferase